MADQQDAPDGGGQGSRANRRKPSLFSPVSASRRGQRKQSRVLQLTLDADVANALALHCTFTHQRPGVVVGKLLGKWLRESGKGREHVWGNGGADDPEPPPTIRKIPGKSGDEAAA